MCGNLRCRRSADRREIHKGTRRIASATVVFGSVLGVAEAGGMGWETTAVRCQCERETEVA